MAPDCGSIPTLMAADLRLASPATSRTVTLLFSGLTTSTFESSFVTAMGDECVAGRGMLICGKAVLVGAAGAMVATAAVVAAGAVVGGGAVVGAGALVAAG